MRAAWVPGRREPRHGAEMITQFLCGEGVTVIEAGAEWARCRARDGYVAWAPAGGLLRVGPEEAMRWRTEAGARSLGTGLRMPLSAHTGTCPPGSAGCLPNHLPWGSRVAEAGDGCVRLPGGDRVLPERPEAIVSAARRLTEFPAAGPAVLSTARAWCGAPYVWGGRDLHGVDCSGFVQAVFEMHGVSLPRDAREQLEASSRLDLEEGGAPDLEAGDLLFFAPEGGRVSHVAISGGGARVLHASAALGGVGWTDLAGDGAFERMLRESWVGATRPLEASRASPMPGNG